MGMRTSLGRKFFIISNSFFILFITLICIIPILHIIALSLSEKSLVAAGMVSFWPRGFTLYPYVYLFQRIAFWRSFLISIIRVVTGTVLNLFLLLLTAYPLSKESVRFRFRTGYVWYFFITILIGGGLIPSYLLVTRLGLKNTIFALILPGALPVFSLVLMINFFRQIPKELEEAALIDGAGHLFTLVRIFIPCSLAAIATVSLFCMVGHWNSWFDGMIYMSSDMKPLQTYLRDVVINLDMTKVSIQDIQTVQMLSDRSLRSAQIIISIIPIFAVYPFLQRYFVGGVILGSVKG